LTSGALVGLWVFFWGSGGKYISIFVNSGALGGNQISIFVKSGALGVKFGTQDQYFFDFWGSGGRFWSSRSVFLTILGLWGLGFERNLL